MIMCVPPPISDMSFSYIENMPSKHVTQTYVITSQICYCYVCPMLIIHNRDVIRLYVEGLKDESRTYLKHSADESFLVTSTKCNTHIDRTKVLRWWNIIQPSSELVWILILLYQYVDFHIQFFDLLCWHQASALHLGARIWFPLYHDTLQSEAIHKRQKPKATWESRR